jgi:hypothetical protein
MVSHLLCRSGNRLARALSGWSSKLVMRVRFPSHADGADGAGELELILVPGSNSDAAAASATSSLYGVAMLLGDIGLIGFGVLAFRQPRTATRRARHKSARLESVIRVEGTNNSGSSRTLLYHARRTRSILQC